MISVYLFRWHHIDFKMVFPMLYLCNYYLHSICNHGNEVKHGIDVCLLYDLVLTDQTMGGSHKYGHKMYF